MLCHSSRKHLFLKWIFKAKETVFQTAMMFYGGYSTTASQNSPQGAEYNSDRFLVKGKKLLATEVIQFNKNSVMNVKSFCTELSGSHSWQTESWTTLQACNLSCIFVSWNCLVSYLCFMRTLSLASFNGIKTFWNKMCIQIMHKWKFCHLLLILV